MLSGSFGVPDFAKTDYDRSLWLDGVVEVEGKPVKWRRNITGHLIIQAPWGDLWMDGNPDPERIRCALMGYESGYQKGCDLGKARLQNDFRNLMGLQ
jgi:hypothetical protein